MTDQHPHDLLGPYTDGELPADETARIAKHLTACTECSREIALIRSMGGAMRGMVASTDPRGLWGSIHSRISRPIGWILFIAGVAVWFSMGLWEWFRSRELGWKWLSLSAVWIGMALVAVGVGYEQYREWRETRYKDIRQ